MLEIYKGLQNPVTRNPVKFDTSLRDGLDTAARYLPAPGLVDAVNLAMLLGQPLLLNGEPGTGKSGLAYAVANELCLGDVYRVNCKTDMQSSDLFFSFDHMRRLRESRVEKEAGVETYVSLQGLGAAIVRAAGKDHTPDLLRGTGKSRNLGDLFPDMFEHPAVQSVVLIDEIDKAPRDVPNDLLFELDRFQFDIPELGIRIKAKPSQRPLVVVTSNSEKALPAPFLRRCVFFTIPFPDWDLDDAPVDSGKQERPAYNLENIVVGRIEGINGSILLQEGLQLFGLLRESFEISNPPSPAEFLNWLLVLKQKIGTQQHLRTYRAGLLDSLTLLLKNDNDAKIGRKIVKNWLVQK
ncbi:MoxR family ATPase [Ruegeria sp. HKCCD8929]|uniref:AAA family ATPase n=1 Tax=Ruegeria sp. HKCCD8929 TaxID=2683006 RepID=UPI00148852BE|nr:MoxR family ATPase [Ruegeria sp. HKCCD8929]